MANVRQAVQKVMENKKNAERIAASMQRTVLMEGETLRRKVMSGVIQSDLG